MTKSSYKILLNLFLVLLLSLIICGCESTENKETPVEEPYVETELCPYCKKCCKEGCTECVEKCTCEPVTCNVETWSMMEGTDLETTVYLYTTNKEGPRVAIVGGIHGDEVAGWKAGLELVEKLKTESGLRGTILLIPQANILADNAKKRYKVTGYNFSDLNRAFPLDRYSTSTNDTISLADALREEVENFDADYIIDLHESRHSWTSMEEGTYTSLGDTLIADNQSRFMRQLIKYYNDTYKLEEETNFRLESSNQKGSFNYYFTNTYPDKYVFTVETNRLMDSIVISTRVRQQLNIIEALFDLIWERV